MFRHPHIKAILLPKAGRNGLRSFRKRCLRKRAGRNITSICRPSSSPPSPQPMPTTHCAAFLTLTLARKTKAFLRQSASFSAARKACMSSAASGKMRRGTVYGVQGEHGVLADVGVAVLQTGAARGEKGSRRSVSLTSFWRKRSVEPRMYSFGCCCVVQFRQDG